MADRPRPPGDLVAFLNGREPRSLLLTGPPGAGKTTLALSLVGSLGHPAFYISTRVGRGNLLHHFPWLVGYLPPERLIDLEEVRPPSERQEDLIHLLDHLSDRIDPLSAGRRLREFLNFPENLARSLAEPPAKAGHRVLCIDSWEGLVEPYVHLLGLDDLGRSGMEHGLLSLFQSASCSLILCAEGAGSPSLEYLCDGVVSLACETADGHIARSFRTQKLRGMALSRSTHAFTLNGAVFTACPAVHPTRVPVVGLLEALPIDHVGGADAQSPIIGVPPLDETVGHLRAGDSLLNELDSLGSSSPLAFLMVPLLHSGARAGWKAALLPDLAHPTTVSAEDLTKTLPDPKGPAPFRFLSPRSNQSSDEIWRTLLEAVGPRVIVDVSVRSLRALLGLAEEQLIARLGQLQLLAREQGALLVFVAGSDDPALPTLRTMVNYHLKVREFHGTFLISGRSPPTANYVVAYEGAGKGDGSIRVLPMS